MKYLKLTIIIAFATFKMQAQSIQRSVIGSAGKVSTSGNFKLSYTVGETITKKVSASGLSINQGFQQNKIASTPLPIAGLEFTAIRINNTEVQLTWKTAQEINNKGFSVERKFETENEFSSIGFEPSRADYGNSVNELNYLKVDYNPSAGSTYYRLRQEDLDGKFSHSMIRVIPGEMSNAITLKVWPIPATDYVNVLVDGIKKPETIELVDAYGNMMKSYKVFNQAQQRIEFDGISRGIYFVRLKGDDSLLQKIVVD